LKGIGQETADTILLYAAEKPIFVIDAYTERFVKAYLKDVSLCHGRFKPVNYEIRQKFFMDNLPLNVKLFQDYHALIVRWGKI
jgi:endonuclease-3 related protein